MSTLLLLATPDATSNKMEYRQVTLANYHTCASLYVKSKTAELPSQPEILTTGRSWLNATDGSTAITVPLDIQHSQHCPFYTAFLQYAFTNS